MIIINYTLTFIATDHKLLLNEIIMRFDFIEYQQNLGLCSILVNKHTCRENDSKFSKENGKVSKESDMA